MDKKLNNWKGTVLSILILWAFVVLALIITPQVLVIVLPITMWWTYMIDWKKVFSKGWQYE